MGLLDSIAYGLAGGAAGGAEAAQPALARMQQADIQSQLDAQTSDLKVSAEKQIMLYSKGLEHDEQAQIASLLTGDPSAGAGLANTNRGSSTSTATPSAPSTPPTASAANERPDNPGGFELPPGVSLPPPGGQSGPAPTAGGQPGPSPTAGGQSGPAPTAGGQPGPDPTAGGQLESAPTAGAPGPEATPSQASGPGFLEQAKERLVRAGRLDDADKISKMMPRYTIAGGGAFGQQVLLNSENGEHQVINDQGAARLAAQRERDEADNATKIAVAQERGGRVAAEAKAAEIYTVEKKSEINWPDEAKTWGQTNPLDPSKSQPHPGIVRTFTDISDTLYGQDPLHPTEAMRQARQLTSQLADSAQQYAVSKGFKPGTPEFNQARDQALAVKRNALFGNGQPSRPAPKPAAPAPRGGLLESDVPLMMPHQG